jgi:hypothetical protein
MISVGYPVEAAGKSTSMAGVVATDFTVGIKIQAVWLVAAEVVIECSSYLRQCLGLRSVQIQMQIMVYYYQRIHLNY